MKINTLWLVCLPFLGAQLPLYAAKCSAGANCRACSNCSGCGHCAKGGGTCSVCRPDLYRQGTYTPPHIHRPPTYSPPPSTYNPPVYREPAPRRVRPRRQTTSIEVPNQFSGRVVGVADGDTITVLYQARYPIKIRLYGIDAPEKAQAFGQQAKNFTSKSTFSKTATIYSKGSDRYGRVLGWVFVGRTCVNTELVRNGLAWWYRQYSPNETKLAQYETEARAAKIGLWSDPNAVAPWQWRRR